MKPDFEKGNGLLPTVVQDAETKDVLMVVWMNEESFHKTLETRETWFWSRSREELWHKGGHQRQCATCGEYGPRL